MSFFIKTVILTGAFLLIHTCFVFADQPPVSGYPQDVSSALEKAGRNSSELVKAIEEAEGPEREGMFFLIANMPDMDLTALGKDFLVDNNHLAYQAMKEVPWGKDVPTAIFLNDILPYASINERRDNWRRDFHDRFIKIAQESKSIDEAAIKLNKYVFDVLHVAYHATKRPKPDQSPYESMAAHYASCTGLSVLLTDALRSVGIPARLAGTPLWADESGNHTWVEIWDGKWHYMGAAESIALDRGWFSDKASHTDDKHRIYATSFKKTGLAFPMRWAPELHFVPAVDVSDNYRHAKVK